MKLSTITKPRFDRETHIAWLLDVDRGYRDTAQPRWRFVRLADVPSQRLRWWERQSVDLTTAIGHRTRAPAVQLEPRAGGTIRVKTKMRLVARRYGERLPQVIDSQVALPYGTVIRAGPLVFALLYREQVESISEGRVSLPFVGEALDLSVDEGLELKRFSGPIERRSRTLRLWKGLFGASFLLTGACAVALVLLRGIHFRYGNSPLDTIVASVGCVFLIWFVHMLIGLPIHSSLLEWVYLGPESDKPRELR